MNGSHLVPYYHVYIVILPISNNCRISLAVGGYFLVSGKMFRFSVKKGGRVPLSFVKNVVLGYFFFTTFKRRFEKGTP